MKIFVKSYLSNPSFSGTGQIIERNIFIEKCTVADLLEDLNISDQTGLVFVNHNRVGRDYPLEEGCVVEIVPILEGG